MRGSLPGPTTTSTSEVDNSEPPTAKARRPNLMLVREFVNTKDWYNSLPANNTARPSSLTSDTTIDRELTTSRSWELPTACNLSASTTNIRETTVRNLFPISTTRYPFSDRSLATSNLPTSIIDDRDESARNLPASATDNREVAITSDARDTTTTSAGNGYSTKALSLNQKNARRKMGLLSALLQWNKLDPPSRSEQLRNDRVCSLYQHNRNPFVDHPEFANLIWRNPPAKSPTLVRKSPKAWVNEFHYENKGKDVNEVHHPLIHHFFLQFVELVIHTSLDAKDLMLVLYNGANGRMYDSLNLADKEAFIVTESSSGYLIYTTFTTLQNGPADGIALVYCTGGSEIEVLEFISYEGNLRAHDGPAKGIVSVDVMLKETDESSEQDSLGLAGRKVGEFAWRKLSGNATPGKLNAGQMF